MHSVIVSSFTCAFADQVSKAGRPACTSEGDNLKCGLPVVSYLWPSQKILQSLGVCPPWVAMFSPTSNGAPVQENPKRCRAQAVIDPHHVYMVCWLHFTATKFTALVAIFIIFLVLLSLQ